MTDECVYCDMKFEEGQDIIGYMYELGVLNFCSEDCASSWFINNECYPTVYCRGDE